MEGGDRDGGSRAWMAEVGWMEGWMEAVGWMEGGGLDGLDGGLGVGEGWMEVWMEGWAWLE